MATNAPIANQNGTQKAPLRIWQEYAFMAYARIVARKHGSTTPNVDPTTLSSEELEMMLATIRDLAHLPPA